MNKWIFLLGSVSAFSYKKITGDYDGSDLQISVSLTNELPAGGEFWLVFPKVNGESMVKDAANTNLLVLEGDIGVPANILRIEEGAETDTLVFGVE